MCHTLRSCAVSSVILYSFMSSLMLSSHLFLGLPLLFFPCTCIFSIFLVVIPPLRSLRHGHTISVFSVWGMLSFVRYWPLSRRLHSWCGPSWSVVHSFCLSSSLTAQHSDPYLLNWTCKIKLIRYDAEWEDNASKCVFVPALIYILSSGYCLKINQLTISIMSLK